MSRIAAALEHDRTARAIDWAVFGLGAASLALAVTMTLVNVLASDRTVAGMPAPAVATSVL